MVGAIISAVLIVLKFAYEVFQLLKEKDAKKATEKKEAIHEGLEILANSKCENLPEDRRRITAAFARNKRLRS